MTERSILVVAHAHRDETVRAADRVISALRAAGARPVLSPDDHAELTRPLPALRDVAVLGADVPVADIEKLAFPTLDQADRRFDMAQKNLSFGSQTYFLGASDE